MANERLRAAIFSKGFDPGKIGEKLGVDRKTVDRWIDGTVPYQRNRSTLAALLKTDPSYFWPTTSHEKSNQLSTAEVVTVWAKRFHAPSSVWLELFQKATNKIDLLMYAGFWLSEDLEVREVLKEKAEAGVQLRFLFGAPNSNSVTNRGLEEGIGDSLSAKIRNAMHNYRNIFDLPNTEVRLHDTTLYNSIYRTDDTMFVNSHIYGQPANMTPLLHLQRISGGELFSQYAESIDRIWDGAQEFAASESAA